MSKSYVPNHSELCLRIHKWLDDIHSGYDVDLTDRDGTNHGYLINNAIERLATLLGDELEAFEHEISEISRPIAYDEGYEEGYSDGLVDGFDDAAAKFG